MFELLAHRGFWLRQDEKNSETAFRRALELGFGIETDLRDHDGEIVISHDAPRAGAMSLTAFLDLCAEYPATGALALNIKADGLAEALAGVSIPRAVFYFDMSVPDSLGFLRRALPVYTRSSDVEPESPLDARAQGRWLDRLESGWTSAAEVTRFIEAGVSIAVVSPELHGREHLQAWEAWRPAFRAAAQAGDTGPRVSLCTDFPTEAAEFFDRS
jgi:glycerophosphoryl diester phosphodiesterase